MPQNAPTPDMVQNELTVIVDIKDGWWNLVRITLALRLTWFLAWITRGAPLSGIDSIHFGHWAIIPNIKDKRRSLLFCSNYDGSWEKYIHDFSDRAADGLDRIWLNCDDYPEKGARDIDNFKHSIRINTVPAQVFYSAYPDSTARNNRNNLAIRRLVERLAGLAEVRDLLRRL